MKVNKPSVVALAASSSLFCCSVVTGQGAGNLASRESNVQDTWRPKIGRHKRWMQIDCGSPSASPETPIVELAAALTPNPQVNRFRVVWDFGVFTSWSSHAATYDRKRQTLVYRRKGGNSFGEFSSCHLFTGVTDTVIQKAARAQEKGDKAVDIWDNLGEYGCKGTKLYEGRRNYQGG